MNRTSYLALAFVIVVSGYAMLSGDYEPVTSESVVLSESPVANHSKSNELPRPVNTKKEDPVVLPKEDEGEEIDRAYQYQIAIAEFEALAPVEQLQQRKDSLGKLITGKKISVNDEVAFQQEWERAGRAEPGYQHKKESTIVNVNGTKVDYAQPGIVVADQVMIYVPESKRGILSELSSIAGIHAIEPVFEGAKPSNVPGKRDITGWQKISLNAPADRIKGIARALESFHEVDEAEPVYERKLSITPPTVQDLDDPMMGDQWHLDAANVKAAWDYLEANDLPAGGDDSIVVAVIDSGVDYNHPDLSANMWVNTQEIPGNNIDDDENGFIDDIHGVSVVSENFSHSGDPNDDNGHGTHVAGIIASTGGNDVGGVGVAFNSKIMAIKAAQYSGVLTTTDIAEAIYYAVDNGADVINMSFGGYGRSQLEEDALVLAYSQAVLVAAAGNDARFNQAACKGAPAYPASHAWVLGVMSRNENSSTNGDYLSNFSNKDCVSNNGYEYELMAPGSQVWSTLPGDSYSAWSGTSMAAPVVAGIAVLARTRWPDKSVYSSRFIMGQVGATGPMLQAYTPLRGLPVSYRQADAYTTLTSTPQPRLVFDELWLFDAIGQGSVNDNDGKIDAGERIELGIAIRNRWGKADNVIATLSNSDDPSDPVDPYVTFETSSVNYGAIGSFNKDDNGLEYDEDLLVTGVRNPFVFSVDANTPNNHIIPFTLTMTAENGLDSSDSTTYTFTSNFTLTVQRGRELPSIIDSDAAGTDGGSLDTDGIEDGVVTLDSSALWIIDKPVLVAEDTRLRVTEGAQIQFWSSKSDQVYNVFQPSYLQVEGILDVQGSQASMVTLFPSALYPGRAVGIQTAGNGIVLMTYSRATNIIATGNNFQRVDYNIFDRIYPDASIIHNSAATQEGNMIGFDGPVLPGLLSLRYYDGTGINYDYLNEEYKYTGNRIYKLGRESVWGGSKPLAQSNYCCIIPGNYNYSLVEAGNLQVLGSENSVFLKNFQAIPNTGYSGSSRVFKSLLFRDRIFNSKQREYIFKNNAILNTWLDPNPDKWGTFLAARSEYDGDMDISNNYWGGASGEVIDFAINDYKDNFSLGEVAYTPVLESPPTETYPFVVKAEVLDADGNLPDANRIGAQASKWRVTFNRDMDITAQPLITFGPAEPFTDFSVPGDWVDARTWEGAFTFTSITGDGWQNIRVAGAVAADNAFLVTGDDSERFRFELITSGVEALTLQAVGSTDQVSLEWMQDDFELLHGYNLYRSMSEDGAYTRVNSSTIDKTIMEYVDTDVTPGVPHYYYFTVVSDGGESSPSNIAMATPVDTIDPVITHKTETVVSLDDSLTLRATVTDNIAVSSVNIVFRNAASSSWQTRAMLLTDADDNRYSVTMDANDIGNQYLEYYIEAKDAVNTVTNGSAESPYKVFVSLPSDTDTDGDGVSNADDAFPYDPTETTDLDGDGVGDNADLDDDGDGYNDDVDAFPRDASEWVDTDGDGIGNNSDNDDDNDGVDDGSDRFPLDARGSRDSDNDGMPDQWETDNGLDPNDASDADSDVDFDGFTALQEFEADTSPLVSDQITQIVYHESSPFVAGFANNVRVMYRPSDASSGLNGLGLRVHYNSQYIDSLVIDDVLLVDLVSLGTVSMPDSADFDNDPLTDSYMNIAWATTSGSSSWPGGSTVKLFDMKVSFSESVTANTKIHIRFTSSSTHPGYGFSSVPIKTTVNVNSLDIDGNGDPDALSDGLLILRSLFGLTDDALIQNAVATDANFSSSAAIQSRINNLGDFLDIDGNGAVDPLSDGLLILRYLFGIRGADLINGVVALDATRNTAAEIEEYLAKMVPNL